MSAHAMTPRTRWIVAAIGAALVMGLLAPLFLLPRVGGFAVPAVSMPPPVKLADPSPTNPLLREVTAMRDLAPLFLPTERNAGLTRLPRPDVGRTLLDMEAAKFSVAEAEVRFERDLPAGDLGGKPVTVARPLDALPPPASAPGMLGLGRSDVPVEPLLARGAYVEVVAIRTGEFVFGESLAVAVKPATDKPWGPIQFLANVDAAGLIGPLILTERSGAEEVDQHFRNYLAQTYRIGQRLAPGIYRVTVGP